MFQLFSLPLIFHTLNISFFLYGYDFDFIFSYLANTNYLSPNEVNKIPAKFVLSATLECCFNGIRRDPTLYCSDEGMPAYFYVIVINIDHDIF